MTRLRPQPGQGCFSTLPESLAAAARVRARAEDLRPVTRAQAWRVIERGRPIAPTDPRLVASAVEILAAAREAGRRCGAHASLVESVESGAMVPVVGVAVGHAPGDPVRRGCGWAIWHARRFAWARWIPLDGPMRAVGVREMLGLVRGDGGSDALVA